MSYAYKRKQLKREMKIDRRAKSKARAHIRDNVSSERENEKYIHTHMHTHCTLRSKSCICIKCTRERIAPCIFYTFNVIIEMRKRNSKLNKQQNGYNN